MKKWELAFEDWKQGMKYQEIADKYGVSLNTVRSWKTRFWNKKQEKKCAENVLEDVQEKKRNVQPKVKAGAPKGNKNALGNKGGSAPEGNQNAIGNKGGAPEGNKNNLKHGIYEKLLYSALSEEEKALFQLKELDRVEELKETIRLCDIQIMRFMRRIREAEEKPGGLLANSVNVTTSKIGNEDKEIEVKHSYTTTNTIAAHNLILKYNDAIEKVKRQKIKCLEDLRVIEENSSNPKVAETSIQIYIPSNQR